AVGLFRVAASTNRVSDAAADIARLARRAGQVHPLIQDMFKYVEEHLMQVEVVKGSSLIDSSIEDLWNIHDINVDVIAVRRKRSWVVNPNRDWIFNEGDVAFVRGSLRAIEQIIETASGRKVVFDSEDGKEPEDNLESLLLDLKETSEFMVSLAFAAVKYQDSELANEVGELEERVDRQCESAVREILARKGDDVNDKLDLLRLVIASEQIADAAWEMAAVQLSGLKTHPIIASIADEAEMIVSRVEVHPDSPLAGQTLRDLALDDNYGIYVLSVRRKGHWFHQPSADFMLRDGDVFVFDGYKKGLEEIRKVANPTYSSD
ncbi:MAG: potassium channel family protein, partial [Promethearchaeia archaeon]